VRSWKHKVKAAGVYNFANHVVIRQETNLRAGADEPGELHCGRARRVGKDARKLMAEIGSQCMPEEGTYPIGAHRRTPAGSPMGNEMRARV